MWNFGDVAMNIVRACPTIGQHTDEIKREMGFGEAEVGGCREEKVIG